MKDRKEKKESWKEHRLDMDELRYVASALAVTSVLICASSIFRRKRSTNHLHRTQLFL
jgi:hypothetical protein